MEEQTRTATATAISILMLRQHLGTSERNVKSELEKKRDGVLVYIHVVRFVTFIVKKKANQNHCIFIFYVYKTSPINNTTQL